MKAPLANCKECPLKDKPIAKTQGPPSATVAFVSRSPGFHEANVGKPFSGPSGKVLDHLLSQNNVKREDILVTNVVLCAPDSGKIPPEAIKCCAPRLKHEIKDCSLVIAGGSEAVNAVIGRGNIDKYRGYRINRNGRTFVATNNPALALRDDSTFPNLVKDFRRAFNPMPQPAFPKVEVITDGGKARDFIRSLSNYSLLAADLETRGGLTHKARIVTLQIAVDGACGTVLSESDYEKGIFQDRDFIESYLRPLFESEDHRFIWHNGIFDTKVLRYGYGIRARVDEDTLLLSYDLDERPGVHSLEYLLAEEFAWPDYEPSSVKEFKKTGIVSNYGELWQYAGVDAAGTYQLFQLLLQRHLEEKRGGSSSYRSILLPSISLVRAIETNGMVYDISGAADIYDHEVQPELERLVELLQDIADNPLLNPRSPTQIAAVYYDRWGVTHTMQNRPDMERSVDESARIEILEGRFKVGREVYLLKQGRKDEVNKMRRKVVEFTRVYDRFQKLQKQASTYIVKMVERAEDDPESRVYTSLLLHGTTTGRLSSREPNLQNITRTKEGLPDIRALFKAPPGWKIVQADYSQAELRCIAVFSNDKELNRIYRTGESLHKLVASRFYGENYTGEQYSNAKNMNFGVAYRQSAATFQEKHGVPEEEAERFIKWWWKQFPGVAEWEREVENEVRSKGKLVSPFGRCRRFYLLTKENIQAVYREAINFYPQSTASDLTLTSATKILNEIDPAHAKLCLTVHDSILAEVDENYIEEYLDIAQQIMETRAKEALGWDLPFEAEFGYGDSWGEAK